MSEHSETADRSWLVGLTKEEQAHLSQVEEPPGEWISSASLDQRDRILKTFKEITEEWVTVYRALGESRMEAAQALAQRDEVQRLRDTQAELFSGLLADFARDRDRLRDELEHLRVAAECHDRNLSETQCRRCSTYRTKNE